MPIIICMNKECNYWSETNLCSIKPRVVQGCCESQNYSNSEIYKRFYREMYWTVTKYFIATLLAIAILIWEVLK